MHRALTWIHGVLIPTLGPVGLFAVAFLDSSFLSLPEINDFLVVTGAATHPDQTLLLVLCATLGSVAGCAVLWWLGRWGGEALLVRRFGAEWTNRARAAFSRWDLLALAVPALLPPPMPFKIFVLGAGVFEISFWRFVVTITLARGLRYVVWGSLGVIYGDAAQQMLKAFDVWSARHMPWLLGGSAVAVLAIGCAYFWRRRRAASIGAAP
jgi:membrane protein YqaA with SNARE-associated domain